MAESNQSDPRGNLKDWRSTLSEKGGNHWDQSQWRYQNLVGLLEMLGKSFQDCPHSIPHCNFLNQKRIINLINLLHFLDREVMLVFQHQQQERIVLIPGKPRPCQGHRVFCEWRNPENSGFQKKGYRFLCLMVDEGRSLIIISPDGMDIEAEGITIDLPGHGVELTTRQHTRYRCEHLPVEVLQEGVVCEGLLVEFSVSALSIQVRENAGSPWQWINTRVPVKVLLREGGEIIYSGDGKVLKEKNQDYVRTIIIQPMQQQIQRVQQREFRTDRLKLNPAPNITFFHPIIKKLVKLPIGDLSISGFSIEEEDQTTLLPGLIIPELKIEFADLSTLTCRAQVIYRKRLPEGVNKYGLVILSIDPRDHWKLSSLLNRSIDGRLDVSGQIDLDSLWKLFFTSGFIYPQKYSHMQVNREHFQQLYKRIYLNNPEISRHFTYQERGVIRGHIAMLRVYSHTWMIHHYVASQESRYKRVGLILLNQIQRYITDSLHVEFPHMEYIICYFRPENKFPNLIFGGAARRIRDARICSLDTLVYLNFPMVMRQEALPDPWNINPATPEDLEELESWYRIQSGGLMLKALDLSSTRYERDSLSEKFAELGLKRKRYVFAIKKSKNLKAVVAITDTDVGLNLSELTNSSMMIVVDPEDLPFDIFLQVLCHIGSLQKLDRIPLLLFPRDYAVTNHISFERTYLLWAYHSIYSDYYFKYMQEIFSRVNGLNATKKV